MTNRELGTWAAALMLVTGVGCAAEEAEPDPMVQVTAGSSAGSDGSGGEQDDDDDMKGDSEDSADPTGDDPTGDDPTGNDPTGNDPTGDDPTGDDPTGDDPTAGDTDDGGVMPGDEEYQMCIDRSDGTQCEVCACDHCLEELTVCEMDPGCIAIRDCAREVGCTGIECLGPCGDIINEHGGALGPSTNQASIVSDCYTGNCPGC